MSHIYNRINCRPLQFRLFSFSSQRIELYWSSNGFVESQFTAWRELRRRNRAASKREWSAVAFRLRLHSCAPSLSVRSQLLLKRSFFTLHFFCWLFYCVFFVNSIVEKVKNFPSFFLWFLVKILFNLVHFNSLGLSNVEIWGSIT